MLVNYRDWPIEAKGNAKAPTHPQGQWTAWISAGGQHDAVVVHAPDKECVLALRKCILKPDLAHARYMEDQVALIGQTLKTIAAENMSITDSSATGALLSEVLLKIEALGLLA